MKIPRRTIRKGKERVIDGRVYKYETATMEKPSAQKKAKEFREREYYVRVIPANPLGIKVFSIWLSL